MKNKCFYALLVIIFTYHSSLVSRDDFFPQDNEPLSIIIENDYILYAQKTRLPKDFLLKYNFNYQKIDTIRNDLLPDHFLALASNASNIFLSGITYLSNKVDKRLLIYNKNKKT